LVLIIAIKTFLMRLFISYLCSGEWSLSFSAVVLLQ